jgi:hypothetical protein
MNADGSNARVIDVPGDGLLDDWRWTPDSAGFVGWSGLELYTVALDGSGLTRLSPELWMRGSFGFVPGQDAVWFGANDDGIYTVGLDGGGLAPFTLAGRRVQWLVYSPDGAQVACSVLDQQAGTSTLTVMRTDGTSTRAFPELGSSFMSLVWSPDGTRLAFTAPLDGNVQVLDLASGHVTTLARVGIAEAGGGRVTWPARE